MLFTNIHIMVILRSLHDSTKGLDTQNTNLQWFWHCKFAAISPLICCNAFSMVPCTLPAFSIANSQMLQFYRSTTLFILQFFVQFCVATGLTADVLPFCVILHVFSILIYAFNHIFIKLPWIEDKQQQHSFCIEGKSILGIGYTL